MAARKFSYVAAGLYFARAAGHAGALSRRVVVGRRSR